MITIFAGAENQEIGTLEQVKFYANVTGTNISMNEQSARSLYEQKIETMVNSLLPNGAGTMTDHRLRHALEQVAQTAFSAGESYALTSIMDIDATLHEVNRRMVADGRKPISKRRLQAIARDKHDRWGVGYNITGTNAWLFRPGEIDSLMPGPSGRPRKSDG